jgi:hypothetical protein
VTPDSKSNWDIFNKKDNPKSKIKQAAMLQTANANLLMSMLGTEAKIAVLPIEMSVSTTDDKILSANKPTSPTLLATDFLIALNKTEAQAEIDKLIPVEKATVTTDIEAKRADIEKRRQAELKILPRQDRIDKAKEELQSIIAKSGKSTALQPIQNRIDALEAMSDYQEAKNKINAKYDAELAALETNVVPADAESSDDVESPAVEAEVKEREVVDIDESLRYKVSDFKADLDKVTTKEELNNLLADLSIKNSQQLISLEDLQEMAVMNKEKANQLNTPQDIKIVPESLAPGTELVAKNTIFVSGVNVQVDETVVVKSVNASNKTIVVTPLNSTSSVTLTFSTLNQSFTLKDAVMNATEIGEEKVTPEDKIKIVESTDLVDTFVQNKTGRIDQIEETASAKSLEELDEELMDDLEC